MTEEMSDEASKYDKLLPPDENNMEHNDDMFENDKNKNTDNTSNKNVDNTLDDMLEEAEKQLQQELNEICRLDNDEQQQNTNIKEEYSDKEENNNVSTSSNKS